MDDAVHLRQLLAPVLAPEIIDGVDAASLIAALVRRPQGASADEADERTFVTKVLRALRPDVFMALPADTRQILLTEVCEYLRSGLYVVISFRCAAEKSLVPDGGGEGLGFASSATLLEDLLNLLEAVIKEADAALEDSSPSAPAPGSNSSSTKSPIGESVKGGSLLEVCESLAKLAGMVGMGGVTVRELKALLRLLARGPHWQDILRRERHHDSRSGASTPGASAAARSESSDISEELSVSPTLAQLRHPLLRALNTMVTPYDNISLKARPPALWALGGKGSGVQLSPVEWPFAGNEYSFCTWARLQALPQPGERTSLWEYTTSAGAGVSLFMRTNPLTSGAELVVTASEVGQSLGNGHQPGSSATDRAAERGQWTVPNTTLMPGIWYHIAVRHGPAQASSSSSYSSSGGSANSGGSSSNGSSGTASSVGRALGSVFGVKSKDWLVVLVDKLPRLEAEVPVPRAFRDATSLSKAGVDHRQHLLHPTIGRDFSGQLGSVFVFKEAVSDAMLHRVHDATSGVDRQSAQSTNQSNRSSSSSSSSSSGGSGEMKLAPDVDPHFTVGGRRVTLGSLLVSAYDPARVTSTANRGEGSNSSGVGATSMALEVHSGLHGHLKGNTFAWSFVGTDARDVIGSLGGLRALFPLLAPLLTHQPPTPRAINPRKTSSTGDLRGGNRSRTRSDTSAKSDDSTPPRSLDALPTKSGAVNVEAEADEDAWLTNTMMGEGGDSDEEVEDDEDEDDEGVLQIETVEVSQIIEGPNDLLTTTSSIRFKDLEPEPIESRGEKTTNKRIDFASIRKASSGSDEAENLGGGHVRFGSDERADRSLLSRIDDGSKDWDDDDEESNEEDNDESQGMHNNGSRPINAQVSGLEVSLLLRLFANFLHGHDANCREMSRVGGVPLLAGALRRAAEKGALRRCIDKDVGRSLLELSSSVRDAPGGLGYAVDTSLLFDLRIWALSSLTTQLSVLPLLISLVRSEPNRFVPRVHLAPLLTVLQETYCRAEALHDSSPQNLPQQQQPPNATGASAAPRPPQSWLAARAHGPSVVHFDHVFDNKPAAPGTASSFQEAPPPSVSNGNSSKRRQSSFYSAATARLSIAGSSAPAGDKKNKAIDRYDGVATEWQLRAMLLTLIRAVLEALTKADVYSNSATANSSSSSSGLAASDAMSADADHSYYKVGGGWSTVSAAHYVANLDAADASSFIEETRHHVAAADRKAANDFTYHQGLSNTSLETSSLRKRSGSVTNARDHAAVYGDSSQHGNSSEGSGGRSSRNRLEVDVGLMLELLVAFPKRRCAHAIGCVLLDLLRDPKLPNRLVEAIARHAGGSWHGATSLLLRSMIDHPSKCDQLQALGLQLMGAMLRRTSLALLQFGTSNHNSSSNNLGRSASMSSNSGSSTKAGRVNVSMTGSGGSVRPLRPALQDGSAGSTHRPAPLVRISIDSAHSFSLCAVERSRLGSGESSSTTSPASSSHGFSADTHPSLWHDDNDGGSCDTVWRLQDLRASGLPSAKGEMAVCQALAEEMACAGGTDSVRAWALEGGGEAFQRSITKSLRNEVGIPSDVYGTALECAFFSDSLVAALTLHHAIEAHSLLGDRARGVTPSSASTASSSLSAPTATASEPFLLTDFPQLQSTYFLPPPAQSLSRAIAHELTGVPRLTNPAALAVLLRLLPSLPGTQQDAMWHDLERLVLDSTNLAHLVASGQARSSTARDEDSIASQRGSHNTDVHGGVAAAWISAVHDKLVRALQGNRYRSTTSTNGPSNDPIRRTGACTVSFAEEESFEGRGRERAATAVDTRDMPERTSASDSIGGDREGAFGMNPLDDDSGSDDEDDGNAETPAEEARYNTAFNQGARLSGDLLAWSVWLSHTAPHLGGTTNAGASAPAAPSGNSNGTNNGRMWQAPLSLVFAAASHALKPRDTDSARWGSNMSAFRAVLSHALAQLKVCASVDPISSNESIPPAGTTAASAQQSATSHASEGWSALDVSQRRPQWDALVELTLVVAATCLQESCVSALVMRTLPEAAAKLVMPSNLAQRASATEASATTTNPSDQSSNVGPIKGLLQRSDSAATGDAILALQTLELVDLLLGPAPGWCAATEGGSRPLGPPGRFPYQPPLLLSLLQMSLLCLASFSPADPAALANVRRLKYLVEWLLEQPDLHSSALQAGDGGSSGSSDASRKNAHVPARASSTTSGLLPSPGLNHKAKSESNLSAAPSRMRLNTSDGIASNSNASDRRAASSVLSSVGNRLGFSSSRHNKSGENGGGKGTATPAPVDWLVLVVLHVHACLRQAQALVFAPSTVDQAPLPDAASVASVANTAERLYQVLALMVSGRPDLLRNSFGPHIDAHLAALLRCKPVLPPAAPTPPPPDSSAQESNRAARAVIEQSLEWLRDSAWLNQPLGAGDAVRAVVQRLGDQESELEEAVHEAFATAYRNDGRAARGVGGVSVQANARLPRSSAQSSATPGTSPPLAPFPAMPPTTEPTFERRARKAKKSLIKAGEQRKVFERRQRQHQARHLASTWTSVVTQSRRAEWSPWVEVLDASASTASVEEGAASEAGGELPMPPAQWRLSDHRDCFGRRMLLQRNFIHGSHVGCSYEASRAKKMLKDEPAPESAQTSSQVEAAVMQTARNLKLFRPKRNEVPEGAEDGGEGEFGDQEGDQDDDIDSDDDDNGAIAGMAASSSAKSGASAQATAAAVAKRAGPKEFQSTVVLVILGVTVPGTLVLTPYCALFAHDKKKVAAQLAKRHAEPIPPHLLKPFTWRLDSLVEVHNRKWNLKHSAVELYFADGRDVFLDFDGTPDIRKKFWRAIKKRVVSSAAGAGGSGSNSSGGSSSTSSSSSHSGSSSSNSSNSGGSGSSSGGSSSNSNSGSSRSGNGPYMGSIGLLRHPPVSQKPRKVLHDSRLVEAWRSRRISNYEYLLRLNLIAGRSFNDLSQYPVFPWVVADYESKSLDLEDVDNTKGQFRDLSKPIGALTEDRLESYLDRYEDMRGDPDMEPFMYGSHYSTAGYTLNFLLRQEPFTSLAIDFQMGHFDISDRLFSSVASCWAGCNSSMTDVKELIPEWYSFPQMFLNQNAWDLGTVQDAEVNKRVDHVALPPWAKGDTPEQKASEFVRLNRAALESEYVSLHLHQWLDLIFGVDQRSEEKNNVFHPMSYETIADGMEDEMQRIQAANHQKHYGQTPSQLFMKAHPKRLPLNECMRPLCYAPETIDNMKYWTFPKHARPADGKPHGPVQSLSIVGERLITIYGDLTVNALRWNSMPDGTGLPFTLSHRQTKPLPGRATAKSPFALTGATGPYGAHLSDSSRAKRKSAIITEAANSEDASSPTDLGPVFGSFGVCTSVSLSGGSGMAGMLSGSGAAMASGSNSGLSSGGGHSGNGSNVGEMRLLSCGYWDGAFKCHSLDSSSLKLQGSFKGGQCGDVNVLEVGADGQTVVTGGADSTCRVWIVDNSNLASALAANDSLQVATAAKTPGSEALAADASSSNSSSSGNGSSGSNSSGKERAAAADETRDDGVGESSGMNEVDGGHSNEDGGLLRCVHVLYGHEAPVTALAVSTSLDLVVSGASNGHVLLHCLQAGDHVRNLVGTAATTSSRKSAGSGGATLDPSRFGAVSLLVVSAPLGCVVVHCRQSLSLRVFSVNGDLLCESVANQALYAMAVTQAGDLLVAGGSKGLLEVYSIHNMVCLHSKAFQGAATSSGNKGASAADCKGPSSGKAGDASSDLGVQSPIMSLTFGKDFQYLFIGTADGEVWICTDPKIRLEMLDIAINKTFAGMI